MICETDDSNIGFQGDSGAIGRLSVSESGVVADLKGRQYVGKVISGPTIFLLNLAQPVGQAATGGVQTAKVETISNEFCRLEFSKDILDTIRGDYTGEIGEENEEGLLGENDAPAGGKKRKISISTITSRKKSSKSKSSKKK